MTPYAIMFWAISVPVLALLLLLTLPFIPLLMHEPVLRYEGLGIPSVIQFIRSHPVEYCYPEITEQTRYLLAMGLGFLVLLVSAWVFPRLWPKLTKGANPVPPAHRTAALSVQALLSLFIVWLLIYQNVHAHTYWAKWIYLRTLLITIIAIVIAKLAWPRLRRAVQLPSAVFDTLAVLVTLVALLGSVFREDQISRISIENLSNFYHTLGEFAAVLNGRTPKADFFPTYQTIFSYLALPYFHWFGMSLTTFTLLMAAMALLALLLVYLIFKRVTGNAVTAFLLYLPFIGLAFYRIIDLGAEYFSPFTYYAAGPIRYFGPLCIGFLLSTCLLRPSSTKTFLLFFFGWWMALNNLEFSLSALGGALFVLWWMSPKKELARTSLHFLLSGALVVSMFALLTFLRSGSFPVWKDFFLYQKIFGTYGIMSIAMPKFGLNWLVYFTLLGAIARGLLGLKRNPRERLQSGMLIYSGIFGLGACAYYVGRSHWHVLQLVFPLWGFAGALLFHATVRDYLGQDREMRKLSVIPGLWLCLGFVLSLSLVGALPNPSVQLGRLLGPAAKPLNPSVADLATVVKSHARPGENVGIIYDFGYLIALRAGVNNVFPYTQQESLYINSQIDQTIAAFRTNHVRKVFGMLLPELEEQIRKLGFRKIREIGQFTVWEEGGAAFDTPPHNRPAGLRP